MTDLNALGDKFEDRSQTLGYPDRSRINDSYALGLLPRKFLESQCDFLRTEHSTRICRVWDGSDRINLSLHPSDRSYPKSNTGYSEAQTDITGKTKPSRSSLI